MTDIIIKTAQAFVNRGYHVVPTKNKAATIKWGNLLEKEPCLPPNIEEELALVLGEDLIVLDFETEEVYQKFLTLCEAFKIDLNTTWQVKTKRGYHIYFKSSIICTNPVKHSSVWGEFELRTGKQYCLIPPSKITQTGAEYKWIVKPNFLDNSECEEDNLMEFLTVRPVYRLFLDLLTENSAEKSDTGNEKGMVGESSSSVFNTNKEQNIFTCVKNKDNVQLKNSLVREEVRLNNNSSLCFKAFQEFFGIDVDSNMGSYIHCIFRDETRPSTKFTVLEDGHIGYREYHGTDGIYTYKWETAFYALLYGIPLCEVKIEDREDFRDKLSFIIRGLEGYFKDMEAEKGSYRRIKLLAKILSHLNLSDEDRDLLIDAWKMVELSYHGSGSRTVFWLSCRDLARMLRLYTPGGNLNIYKANRILNFFCILGLLNKVGCTSRTHADEYVFGDVREGVIEKLAGYNTYSFSKAKAAKIIGEYEASLIYRRNCVKIDDVDINDVYTHLVSRERGESVGGENSCEELGSCGSVAVCTGGEDDGGGDGRGGGDAVGEGSVLHGEGSGRGIEYEPFDDKELYSEWQAACEEDRKVILRFGAGLGEAQRNASGGRKKKKGRKEFTVSIRPNRYRKILRGAAGKAHPFKGGMRGGKAWPGP
jgi:hypothetical protein